MKSRNSRRAWSRRSWPSRSSVRSTSEEIENPISPPNTTAYSVVRLCSPTIWLLKRRATINAASSTGPALPSPMTARRFFMTPSPLDRDRTIAAHAFRARVQQFTAACESGGYNARPAASIRINWRGQVGKGDLMIRAARALVAAADPYRRGFRDCRDRSAPPPPPRPSISARTGRPRPSTAGSTRRSRPASTNSTGST